MSYATEFRRCMEDMDVAGTRKLWAHANPHLPQPKSDDEAVIMLHHARTQSESMAFRLRAYSHRWLTERDIPSGLPDELKPKAERMYPQYVEAVGVAVGLHGKQTPVSREIEKAMSHAVMECFGDNVTNPEVMRARMMEARKKAHKQLY